MLDTVAVDCHPRMLALLPYRVLRCGKVLVGKCAHSNGEHFAIRTGVIPERRAAVGAEMEVRAVAAVADMLINLMLAADRHRIRRKARLKSESRPAAFLAVIAMADRDADGLASAGGGKLATPAGGGAGYFFNSRFVSRA